MKTILHVSITFIILFPIFCFNAWSNPFTVDQLLQTAKNDYFAGDIQQYASIADTVLSASPENPTANILKGLALLESSKIQDRLTAKEIIEKYARRLDDDAFALYAMGILYKKRNIPVPSRKYFEEALEYDECLVPAMIELGNYYYHQMLNYYHRYTDTEVALSFRKYALEDYDYAVSYLRKALRCDPGNREAANLLGALYYETAEYTLMENLFQEMLQLYPEDMRMNQFLGLAYLSQKKYQQAFDCFNLVLEKMSPEDKQDLYSPEYLTRDKDRYTSTEAIDEFWLKRDPLFLTGENERFLEHFGRFAYANLRFAVPKLNEEGWRTDRGKTYIRYGKPSTVIEYGKSIEFNAIYPPMQIWIYPRFQLAFSDEFWNGLYQFTEPFNSSISIFKERTNINYSLVAENVMAEIPEDFAFALPGGTFTSPYLIKFFKEKKQSQGNILFGIPILDTLYNPVQEFETALFALNDRQLPDYSYKDHMKINFISDSLQPVDEYSFQSLSFISPSGKLSYSFEILNETLQQSFVQREEIVVPDFSSDSLLISDIILADKISPSSGRAQFTKNDLDILPNFLQLFKGSDTLMVYFEIYNLTPDRNGNVFFRVESVVRKENKGGLFGKLFKPDQKTISVVNEYSGKRASEFIIQSIHLNNIDPGEYRFEIIIRDDIAKTNYKRSTVLTIL